MKSGQKVDYLKPRLNIMGYGVSSSDADIKERLMVILLIYIFLISTLNISE
jgi:hypothetical protein